MTNWFDTFGRIKYSPKRLGDHVSPNWWVILEADAEIGRYYRKLYRYFTYNCELIQRPPWFVHCTIVRNEEPPKDRQTYWERWAGRELWLRVYLRPETDGFHLWLPVYCPGGEVLRTELGLSKEGSCPFHLTLGVRPK